ncbi:MAG: Na+-dependent transporter [Blastocatellia bacterium]|nr:Na+-dependent transporter [Blastocatellia bacterium]
MNVVETWVERSADFMSHRLLWLLIGSYVLAALIPEPGLQLRSVNLSALAGAGVPYASVPSVLLSFLLFNAGLGVRRNQLGQLARRPSLLAVGVLANLVLPVVFILMTATIMQLWHNTREVQEILIGLALIASMPVAGSSTAWIQNADGDLALSIGLVVFSTCLSPLTTPLALYAVGWMAEGMYANVLRDLAAGRLSDFLGLYVLGPSLAGIAIRAAVGEERIGQLRPLLKLAGSGVLLTLCYANAAVALPQIILQPDWDYLAVMLVIVAMMCVAGFAAGAVIGWSARADHAQRASLMFGLGMTNNGTGLVIAAGALANMPMVMLPVIFYNLIQHVVAGCVDRYWLGGGDIHPPNQRLRLTGEA